MCCSITAMLPVISPQTTSLHYPAGIHAPRSIKYTTYLLPPSNETLERCTQPTALRIGFLYPTSSNRSFIYHTSLSCMYTLEHLANTPLTQLPILTPGSEHVQQDEMELYCIQRSVSSCVYVCV